jgi:hypothetical protein
MEKSPLPYKIWLWAIYLIATDKRGISAMELMWQLHVDVQNSVVFSAPYQRSDEQTR